MKIVKICWLVTSSTSWGHLSIVTWKRISRWGWEVHLVGITSLSIILRSRYLRIDWRVIGWWLLLIVVIRLGLSYLDNYSPTWRLTLRRELSLIVHIKWLRGHSHILLVRIISWPSTRWHSWRRHSRWWHIWWRWREVWLLRWIIWWSLHWLDLLLFPCM